jgi:HEAT repeats
MNRISYPAKTLFLGLILAQIIATFHVHLSNLCVYQNLSHISKAGYLIIPNQKSMPLLLEWGPAFWGGLFFSLTVGAGLSVLATASAWIWVRLLGRRRKHLPLWLIPWIGLLFLLNRHGFHLMSSLYFILIPPFVFFATVKWMPTHPIQASWASRAIYPLPFMIVALLWTTQWDNRLFLDLRDHLLLSNPLGLSINNFYYKYTLYPAEAFKPMDQKTLKSCYLGNFKRKTLKTALERELLRHDYLMIGEEKAADLTLREEGQEILFDHGGKRLVHLPLKGFPNNLGGTLKEFSEQSDAFVFFRQFTFYSLLLAFPTTLYILVHALLYFLSSLFFGARPSAWTASIVCLALGLTSFLFLYLGKETKIENKDVAEALQSSRWQTRMAALRTIDERRLDVPDLQMIHRMSRSTKIPERYWLAKVLALSRTPETYSSLLALLDDSSPNVVCMALFAMGQRGDSKAIQDILTWMESSDHWYCQWYAYGALKALGWKQSKSH